MTLYNIVDVNTYTWIVKTSMGTTRDHATNQFDIYIKLSANYPLVLREGGREGGREGENSHFISHNISHQ